MRPNLTLPVGDELRRRRVAAGLRAEDLAHLSGLSVSTIRRLEADRGGLPTRGTLRLLELALTDAEGGRS